MDLISRQDAIDVIEQLEIPEDMCVFEILSHIELAIGTLPSAQPERKKGKWISDRLCTTNGGTYGVRRCSVCESYYHDVVFTWNYCPHCGADMRGEEDE